MLHNLVCLLGCCLPMLYHTLTRNYHELGSGTLTRSKLTCIIHAHSRAEHMFWHTVQSWAWVWLMLGRLLLRQGDAAGHETITTAAEELPEGHWNPGREEWHSSKGRNQNLSQHVTATSVHTTSSWIEDSTACNSSTFSNPSIRGRGQRRERGGRCEGRENGERLLNWKSSQRWGKECRDMPIPDSYFYPKCHPKDVGQ